ncbi:MAG: MFS transporter [Planctomycetaceae bacterium]|nr:MFS transporter [Planctomycetaceae bacterium]
MTNSSPRLPRNVRLLGWASLLNDIASEMVYPLLPQFLITVLGGTRMHLGVIEGIAESTASLLKLWSGALSDRLGRRKQLVVAGYSVACLVRPVMAMISAPWQLFLLRTTDRVGKGIRTSPRDALIADSTPPDQRGRAFGFHRAMDHLGAAIGPLLAMLFLWLRPDDLRTLFLLTLVPGLAVIAVVLFGLRETDSVTAPSEPVRLTLAPFGRSFRIFLVALVLFTLGNSSDAFLLVRAGELGVPTWQLPLLWLAFHLAKSGGNVWLGRWVDRVGARLPITIGWLIYALVYLAFGFADAAWHAWALFLVYALFYALTEPAEKSLVTELAGPERKGLAFGWFHFAIGVSALPSSLIFGVLYERSGAAVAFGWGAALSMLALGLLGFVSPPQET